MESTPFGVTHRTIRWVL